MMMMKRSSTFCVLVAIASLCLSCSKTQSNDNKPEAQKNSPAIEFSANHDRENLEIRPSPNAAVAQTIGTTEVMVTYGRPGMKGRTIFGDLIPYGQWWRTGANESTNVTFSDNVTIAGQELEAGTYSLYSIPGKDSWTIIFNSKLSWGTEYDKSKDVLRVDVEPQEAQKREWFMIYFENLGQNSADMVLHWSSTKVPIAITV